MPDDYLASVEACPWCGSTNPTVRKPRFLGILCASAWHSDHPEHERMAAHFGSSVTT